MKIAFVGLGIMGKHLAPLQQGTCIEQMAGCEVRKPS